MTGYYDVVLGLIPLAIAIIAGTLSVAGFGLTTALPVASVAAIGLIGHAMFVRTPGDREQAEASSESIQPADRPEFRRSTPTVLNESSQE